jgi:hypothetical protein
VAVGYCVSALGTLCFITALVSNGHDQAFGIVGFGENMDSLVDSGFVDTANGVRGCLKHQRIKGLGLLVAAATVFYLLPLALMVGWISPMTSLAIGSVICALLVLFFGWLFVRGWRQHRKNCEDHQARVQANAVTDREKFQKLERGRRDDYAALGLRYESRLGPEYSTSEYQ